MFVYAAFRYHARITEMQYLTAFITKYSSTSILADACALLCSTGDAILKPVTLVLRSVDS